MQEKTETQTQQEIAKQHEAICSLFGLKKTYEERANAASTPKTGLSTKQVVVLVLAALLIVGTIVGYSVAQKLIDQKEQDEVVAKKQREIEAEEARRNRTEFAEIAFLDSLPEQAAISMDGKKLYAKTPDGSYTALRAGKDTWIRYLPVKESTVIQFGFEAEGFRPLSRKIAYYDWYPAHKGDITLQKIFRKIVMEPDVTPRLSNCEGDACEWTVFREIMFRLKYAETAKIAVINEADRGVNRERVLRSHPALASAVGLDVANLPKNDADMPLAAQNLMQFVDKHPFDLYGTITVKSNVADTRVSFLGEPLMVFKASGSMSQVKVDPEAPYTFSTYGQGHPIVITEPLSLRLEAPGYPSYVTEILPHQWRCEPVSAEVQAALTAPAFTQLEDTKADYHHYLCDYTIEIAVDFESIKAAADQDAAAVAAAQLEASKAAEAKAAAAKADGQSTSEKAEAAPQAAANGQNNVAK